ncbi:MAG: hypothetical protein K6E29_04285, partial [Cyanobacteria bacterium RUI128]|nr:hypothetical protein [Cyanobacteria bacterium RUI128]
VELIAKSSGVTLKADNAVLDKASQTLKLTGHVKIIKNGLEMSGQSLIVNLNEENIIMDNPVAEAYSFIIHAQESYLIANDIQMINGNVECTMKKELPIIPRHFYRYTPVSTGELYDPNNIKETNVDKPKMKYSIDSKESVITSYKDHNSLVLKDSKIYLNNHRIAPKTDIEIISDKENNTIETNSLEIGTFRTFGTYVGYGFVNKLPKGQTLKVMPALTRGEGKFGVGILARHRSRNSMLEAGYSSSTEKFVARGIYRFGNGFTLRYGRNSYIPEGFMGARRSGYAAQLAFEKAYYDPYQKITFNHGAYAGLFSDYKKYGRKHYFSTTRFRYNMQLAKTFFEYKNKEQDMHLRFAGFAQASATVYGTGDTAGVVRIGPTVTAKVKKLESSVGYFLSGIHGDSPFIFDKYRYGKSSFVIHQKLNLNNAFALGYSVTITPDKDNYEHDLFTEQRIYALIGPRDVKLALAYDFVREMGFIDIMFLLGSDNTKINFEKLTTKDIDGAKNKQDFYRKAKKVKVEEI